MKHPVKNVIKTLAGIGLASGIGAAVMLSPLVPSNTHTFTASENGCSITKDGPKSLISILRQRDTSFDEGQDNIVRILRYEGNTTHFGTGYAVGNYILTAAHVVDGKSDGPVQILFQENERPGTVLASDAKTDVALVGINPLILYDPSIKSITIGDVAKGGKTHFYTIDPTDEFYFGGSQSQKTVNQTRYLPSRVNENQIRELETQKKQLQTDLSVLENQVDELLAPYYERYTAMYGPEKQSDAPEIGHLAASTNTQKTSREETTYHYVGQTEADKVIPGMSGSAMFNDSNQLVGIASGILTPSQASASSSFFVSTPDMSEGFMQGVEALLDAKKNINDQISTLDDNIYSLMNPSTNAFVSPQAIVEFLQGYCKTTASSLQQLGKGNSKAYNQVVKHGFTEPPKTLYLAGMQRR